MNEETGSQGKNWLKLLKDIRAHLDQKLPKSQRKSANPV
jgi:hypothetical protein